MTFKCNGTASEPSLLSLDLVFGHNSPADYVNFLRRCNGGEGFINDDYLILWRADEIGQFNREYEVSTYLSGIVLFGSNGGGEAYGFRDRGSCWDVVRVPFVGMDPDVVQAVAESFSQFIGGANIS